MSILSTKIHPSSSIWESFTNYPRQCEHYPRLHYYTISIIGRPCTWHANRRHGGTSGFWLWIRSRAYWTRARCCHKSWPSKADFTWLIFMSHKVCWISHYDVTWLIVLTWLCTRKSLLCLGNDFMTHDCDVIWCNDFRTWLTLWVMSLARVTRWAHDLVYEFWLVNGILGNDSYESLMDFALWLTMSHRGLCSARWWVTRVRVVRRCLYKALGSDQGVGSSRNHLSTFLYSRYCNTITLYSLYIHFCSTRTYGSKNLETIVIVSTGCPNIGLLW